MSGRPAPDSLGLADAATALPETLPAVFDAARAALSGPRGPVPTWAAGTRAVAACGLGTGGLAAQAAARISRPHLAVPFWVGGAAELPAFVGPGTLFFAVSSSGATAETTTAAAEAARRGAAVVAVGGGADSLLARVAAEAGAPWCPLGDVGPRTVLGLAATLVPVLAALAGAGLVPDPGPGVTAASSALARRHDTFVGPAGRATDLARRIGRTVPLFYGADGVAAVAARWWKARVNLNAKSPAFAGTVPATTYDELAGWGQGGDITRQLLTLVLLRHDAEPPEIGRLFEAVWAECDEVMADVLEVRAEGGDDLGRFLDLALLAESVSLVLASNEGVDPGPAPGIDEAHARASSGAPRSWPCPGRRRRTSTRARRSRRRPRVR